MSKKGFALLLVSVLVLSMSYLALAEVITIDPMTASNKEISDAIAILQEEEINRAKASIPPTKSSEEGEILFRGVPWYSTRVQTEAIIGYTSKTKGPNDLYRITAIDYNNVTMGNERVDDYGGCMANYSNVTIAGLAPSSTYICYIYPIVDGKIIADDSLAQIYFGYYKFTSNFSDHEAIYSELQRKLNITYGTGVETIGRYNTTTKWTDVNGNYIQLLINSSGDYVSLGYIAADADERLDEMQNAIDNQLAEQEHIEMQKQENNFGGL